MNRIRNADEFSLKVRSIRGSYKEKYQPLIEKHRQQYTDTRTGKVTKNAESELEAHLRKYLIDAFLNALNWQFELSNIIPEAPIQSSAEKTTRFLDYFGVDQSKSKALIIVETKRPKSTLPRTSKNKSLTIPNIIVSSLLGKIELTNDWGEWLETLRDYTKSVKANAGKSPIRVVITNGDWLILFRDPENTFVSDNPQPENILVYKNWNQIEENANQLFGLLEYFNILGKIPFLSLGEISFHLNPTELTTAMFGMRLLYYEEPELYLDNSPAIKVVPVIFLRAKQGIWFCVDSQNPTLTQHVPHKSKLLSGHLDEFNQISQNLLNDINERLKTSITCSSLADHYADQDLFNELPTVSKLDRIKYEEFLIVTGKNTHYLLKEPTVLNCLYHDWDNSDAEGLAIGPSPIKRPRVKDPRTIFVSSEQHHCSHRDVQSAKSSQITSANRD